MIPADTEVVVLLHALHRHPSHWERPDEFDPSRWLDDEKEKDGRGGGEKKKNHTNQSDSDSKEAEAAKAEAASEFREVKYAPFLDGRRQCIGRHLAELEFVSVMNALMLHCGTGGVGDEPPLRCREEGYRLRAQMYPALETPIIADVVAGQLL